MCPWWELDPFYGYKRLKFEELVSIQLCQIPNIPNVLLPKKKHTSIRDHFFKHEGYRYIRSPLRSGAGKSEVTLRNKSLNPHPFFETPQAAPTEVENAPAEADKSVMAPEAVISPSSDAVNVGKVETDKVVVEEKKPEEAEKVVEKKEEEVKVEDKVEPAKTILSVEESAPVLAAVDPAEEEAKPDEELAEDDEAEKKKKMDETSAICLASTGATLEQVTAISDKPEDDAPKEVKCYVKCIDEQLGTVSVEKKCPNKDRSSSLDQVQRPTLIIRFFAGEGSSRPKRFCPRSQSLNIRHRGSRDNRRYLRNPW